MTAAQYDCVMVSWHVPVALEQPENYPQLSPTEVEGLERSLPGGGSSGSFSGAHLYAARKFTKTLNIQADDAVQAEQVARNTMEDAIDSERFPGWAVASIGEPTPAEASDT